ncbi:MAG: AAA family ATPase [Thermoplasmata archaeon]
MNIDESKSNIEKIINEVKKAVVGKDDVLTQVLIAMISRGHILIEDYPGLAKTLMAKSISDAIGINFKRVQFTPDLLPMDIIGSNIFQRDTSSFKFNPGPIFTNILLADEINRAPPKTQSALLEAMQEYQVTIEGISMKLDEPFIVIATQNPIEFEGTYPLPEAQVDRFLVKLSVGYPGRDSEIEILKRRTKRKSDNIIIENVVSKDDFISIQNMVENIHVDDSIESYIVDIVNKTRVHSQVEIGSSPRGSLALLKLARSNALVSGRDYVIPDDVKSVIKIALSHRIILKPEPWIRGIKPEEIIDDVLKNTPVPKL